MNNLIKNRNIGIDLLRGLSILYIVGFWHMFNYTKAFPEYYNPFTRRLTLIILGTFVFISGYFIGGEDLIINKHNIIAFYKKRLLRIYPLYIIAIYLFTLFNLSNVITSVKAGVMISMLLKPAPVTLWFITMLILFYVISPFLIHCSKSIKANRLIFYYLIFITLLMIYSYFTRMLDVRFVMYFPSFALGVFVANKNESIHRTNNSFTIIIMISSVIFSFFKAPHEQLKLLMYIPMILSCSYFLFQSFKYLSVSSKHACKIIIFLSYSSYCMYLFHRLIYINFKKIYFPEVYLYQFFYLVFLCLPCIICCSFIIQKIFDLTIFALTKTNKDRS
ncbi:acyltransferase family protein [Desulfosarcina ovata]|uniref:acyltransferase family protein n=1 Tax=Desulfosarcina ovata TaxID=83564 RepID=UPI0012D353E4